MTPFSSIPSTINYDYDVVVYFEANVLVCGPVAYCFRRSIYMVEFLYGSFWFLFAFHQQHTSRFSLPSPSREDHQTFQGPSTSNGFHELSVTVDWVYL